MTEEGKKKALFALLWSVIIVIHWIGLLQLSTFPFVDLPNHLAESTLYKFRKDSNSILATFFTTNINWYQSTIAHIVLGSLLSDVVSAYRLLYMLYVVGIPLTTFIIARKYSWDTSISFFSILVLWNFAAIWGFSGYTFSIPLILLYFYFHVNYISKRSISGAVCLCVVLLALYWFHHLAFLFVFFNYVSLEVYNSITDRSARPVLAKWLPLLPGIVLFMLWLLKTRRFHELSMLPFLNEYYRYYYIQSLGRRLFLLFTVDGRAIAAGATGHVLAFLFSSIIVVPAAVCAYRYMNNPFRLSRAQYATIIFTAAAFVCFWILPSNLPGQAFLYKRYSVIFILGLVLVLSWAVPKLWKNFPRYLVVPAVLLYSLLWLHYFVQFKTISSDFTRFFPRGKEYARSTIASVIDLPDYRGRPVLIHYNNYQIIWNHGVTPTRMAEYKFSSFSMKIRLPLYVEWIKLEKERSGIERVINSYAELNYIISQGMRPYKILANRSDYIEVRRLNNWALFKKGSCASTR